MEIPVLSNILCEIFKEGEVFSHTPNRI
jgi:hypothetical protein